MITTRMRLRRAIGIACLALLANTAAAGNPMPKVACGRIERIEASGDVAARPVDVWLPPACEAADAHCPVVYAQDGQMLFDASFTWNHASWLLACTVMQLVDDGSIPPVIVAGVWNAGAYRWSEYFPQKILDRVAEPARGEFLHSPLMQDKALSDAYLKFLVKVVKPRVDARFHTAPDRAHTFVMGSSMGGVISVYALDEYPDVFGGAAALSVHWAGRLEPNVEIPLATFEYLRTGLADPHGHRLYMDHGTQGLDAWYAPYQLFVDELVLARGYGAGTFESRVFEDAGHDEASWAKRVAIPLRFLLGPLAPPAKSDKR